LWGAPRIHGALLKLGIVVGQASVAKYIVRSPNPPSQTWRTFLANHVRQIAAADFFVVPTATCRLLFVLVMWFANTPTVRELPSFGETTCSLTKIVHAELRGPASRHDRRPRHLSASQLPIRRAFAESRAQHDLVWNQR
jgi:hypothetical protein